MAKYKMSKKEKVWKHLIANPLATPKEVAEKVGCTANYVHHLKSTIGTPREVFEAEAKAKAEKATSMFTDFDRAIANAPIRDTVNVWTDRLWQVAVAIGVAVVIGAWLYVGL
tara:strand:+ start:258 stop:593 length:336 start_codon:yes stop_codon:yes gene_type:complete